MRDRYVTTIIILTGFVFLFALGYPSFFVFEPYATSGGISGAAQNRLCGCYGISYSYYPKGHIDGITEYYCLGTEHSCRCFNEEKHAAYLETFSGRALSEGYWEGFEQNAYGACPIERS